MDTQIVKCTSHYFNTKKGERKFFTMIEPTSDGFQLEASTFTEHGVPKTKIYASEELSLLEDIAKGLIAQEILQYGKPTNTEDFL